VLWVYAALALVTVRWWWAAFATLVADVHTAGRTTGGAAGTATAFTPVVRPRGPRPVDPDARAPLNRVLAFRGVAHRVARRGRWQAGFGRRGL